MQVSTFWLFSVLPGMLCGDISALKYVGMLRDFARASHENANLKHCSTAFFLVGWESQKVENAFKIFCSFFCAL